MTSVNNSIPFLEKVEIVRLVSNDKKPELVASMYGMAVETITEIVENREEIMELFAYFVKSKAMPLRNGTYPLMENLLYVWYVEQTVVSNARLRERAKAILRIINEKPTSGSAKKFAASNSWANGFKARYGIPLAKHLAKSLSSNHSYNVASDENLHQSGFHGFSIEDISTEFNVAEDCLDVQFVDEDTATINLDIPTDVHDVREGSTPIVIDLTIEMDQSEEEQNEKEPNSDTINPKNRKRPAMITDENSSRNDEVNMPKKRPQPQTFSVATLFDKIQHMFYDSERRRDQGIEQLESNVNELTCAVGRINDDNDNTDTRLAIMENKIADLRKEVCDQSNKIAMLKNVSSSDNNTNTQNNINANVLVFGVPRSEDENPAEIIANLLHLIGFSTELPYDAFRLSNSGGRFPAILVKLYSTAEKKRLLQLKRNKNIVSTELNIDGEPSTIFIREQISKETGVLFKRARSLKNFGIKFVWTDNGVVLAKADKEAKTVRISNVNDIENFKFNFLRNRWQRYGKYN